MLHVLWHFLRTVLSDDVDSVHGRWELWDSMRVALEQPFIVVGDGRIRRPVNVEIRKKKSRIFSLPKYRFS